MRTRLPIHSIVATILFASILAAYLVLALYFPPAYIFATYEDLIGEWGQAFGFLAAFFFSVAIAARCNSYRWFFALLAVACFYTAGEEVSWGQRVFGFATPEYLNEHNLQGETNLHNLLTGPVDTTFKSIAKYLVATALVGFGLVFPIGLRRNWRIALMADRIGIAAPPLYLWPYFVASATLELELLHFNEAEIAELLVALALAMFSAHYWYTLRAVLDQDRQTTMPRARSAQFSAIMLGTVFAIGASAAGMTALMYNSPKWRPAIENRLLGGYEKFAGRYGKFGRWKDAAMLYLRAQAKDPEDPSYLRDIAGAFRKMGNETLYEIYHQKAFELASRQLSERPDSISVHLSLARTYAQEGNSARENFYAARAHALALERQRDDPNSADSAYWLAKTYREIGDYESARQYYRRAMELNPQSSKYRRTYLEMQTSNDDDQ